jgi:hypothetical protein
MLKGIMKREIRFKRARFSALEGWLCGILILTGAACSFAADARRPAPQPIGKTFTSPDTAAEALAGAAKTKDRAALKTVLGPESDELQMSDQIQAEGELADFAAAFDASHRVVRNSDARTTIVVGTNSWPFPIPLVQKNGQWFFDTHAGKEEIINRRIGRNELSAIESVRAYVDAQREYARLDRDGDDVLEYAQDFLSTPGKKDGLYWSPELDGEISPLGPLVAAAQQQGYMKSNGEKSGPRPFHGYYFKILTRQGKHAPGGKYDYIVNRNMIGGFALVAWPVDYGNSGVMTFIINQQGRAYQKDLGPKTASIARKMDTYDPDPTWHTSPD